MFWRFGLLARALLLWSRSLNCSRVPLARIAPCARVRPVRLLVTIGPARDRVCFGFTRLWRVCLCAFSVACVTGTQGHFACGVCVQK